MNRKHRLSGIAAMAVLLCGLSGTAPAATQVIDRIVAVVNEDIILLSELNARMAPFVQRIRQQGYDEAKEHQLRYQVREDMLNRLVDEKLTDQEIARNGIRIEATEIDNAIERIKAANQFTEEDLRRFLEGQSMTMEAYRDKIKEQILRARLVNYEVKSKIVITEEEIRAYYNSHPELYGGERRYHLRNILLRVPASASAGERAAMQEKMVSIRNEFTAGAAFGDLAHTYSQSPSAQDGGDIGEFDEKTLSPAIREALAGLAAGQVTPVLDTDQGIQLFYLEAVHRTEGKPFESVKAEIHEKLFNEVVDKKFVAWLDALRSQSHIKIIN